MRVSFRAGNGWWLSLGPGALLCLSPFILCWLALCLIWWLVVGTIFLAALLVQWLGSGINQARGMR